MGDTYDDAVDDDGVHVPLDRARALRLVLQTLRRPRWRLPALVGCWMLTALTPLAGAALLRTMVVRFDDRAAILRLSALAAGVVLVTAVLTAAGTWIAFRMTRTIATLLMSELFDKQLRQPPATLGRRGAAGAHARMTRCIQGLTSVSSGLPYMVSFVFLCIGGLAGMVSLSARWTAALAPLLVATALGATWLARRQSRTTKRLITLDDVRVGIVGQVFEPERLRVVKRNALEPWFVDRFGAATARYEHEMRNQGRVNVVHLLLFTAVPALAAPAIWLIASLDSMPLGDAVTLATLCPQVLSAAVGVVNWWVQLASDWPYLRRALAFVQRSAAPVARTDATLDDADLAGQPLVASGLRCTRGETAVLRGVDLRIRPGEWVALTGGNGAGKSTLMDALTGLLPPDQEGTLRIGDVPFHRIPRSVLAEHIRAIDAAPQLFAGTARDNVLLLCPDATEDTVAAACSVAGIAFPLSRHADELSAGQRVQVLIAQMVLAAPRVLFIDEALTHLFPIARADLRHALRRALPGTSVVEVNHEGAVTSRAVDRILVLHDGVVAEQGTHDELMALDGLYAAAVAAGQR